MLMAIKHTISKGLVLCRHVLHPMISHFYQKEGLRLLNVQLGNLKWTGGAILYIYCLSAIDNQQNNYYAV